MWVDWVSSSRIGWWLFDTTHISIHTNGKSREEVAVEILLI